MNYIKFLTLLTILTSCAPKTSMEYCKLANKQSKNATRWNLAEANYKRAIQLDSSNSYAYSGIGILKMNSENTTELETARELFYKSLKYNNTRADVWNYIGYTFIQEKNYKKAIECY